VGLSSVFNLLQSLNKDRKNRFFFTTVNFLFILTAAGVLLTTIFRFQLNAVFNNPFFYKSCLYFFPFIFGQLINTVLYNILIIENRVKFIVGTTIFVSVIKLAFVFISLLIYKSFVFFIVSQSVITVIQVILYFYFIPAEYRHKFFFTDKSILKQIMRYGFPMMLTGILGVGILQVDGIFVSNFLGLKDFAIYRNGAIEFPLAGIIFTSIVSVSVPHYLQVKQESGLEAVLLMKRRVAQVSATILFPLSIYLFFFSDFFIKTYLSDKYLLSAPVFAWYNIALMIRFNDYHDLLVIYGKTRSIFFINLVTFISCLLANYFLIKKLGLTGAIISFLFNLTLVAVLLAFYTCKKLHIRIRDYQNWPKIFLILAVSVGVGAVLYWVKSILSNGIAVNLVTSALYIIFVFGILYKLSLLDDKLVDKLKRVLRLMPGYEKVD
jgi:O-antigen/teichoic acid export membrane protein